MINPNEQYVVPRGGTIIEQGDIILVLTNKKIIGEIRKLLT
ncbi:MAG TPA: hypothetical protein DHV28_07405 [Ignavibacteriales bacterium]|nr:hypothetical protein [Ignavibacteriales bacterium]